MTAYVFDTILTQGVRAGQIPSRTQAARDWFRTAAQNTSVTPSKLMKESKTRLVSTSSLEPGSMYMFNYSPKHKKTLPYYDTFPLIFILDQVENGFMGLNLHYLPLRERARLMDALYSLSSDQRYDEQTKIQLSYNILKGAAKYRNFRPTIKRYLASNVKSRFLKIESVEWDIALFLPTHRFQKASAEKVWQESMRKVR